MTRKLHFCSKILTKTFPLVLVERYLTLFPLFRQKTIKKTIAILYSNIQFCYIIYKMNAQIETLLTLQLYLFYVSLVFGWRRGSRLYKLNFQGLCLCLYCKTCSHNLKEKLDRIYPTQITKKSLFLNSATQYKTHVQSWACP